jgi:hypothetical protein
MTLARAVAGTALGKAKPRLAPPTPARSDLAVFRETAANVGIDLMPWQETAARYLEAQASDGRHLYREVAIVVSRQNGKTELLVPLIVGRLRQGRRIMHTAQDRDEPREVFYRVADIMWSHYPDLFPLRNGRPTKPRYANGQEEIRLNNGGIYKLVAPTRSGARGPTRDLVIIDELREMDDWDFIAAAKPTLTVSPDPQMIYLSNAGEVDSIVLNAIRDRRDKDPSLAYLEWSASPERPADDPKGWAEANPALGHEPEGMGSLTETLASDYRTAKLEGTLGIFETEHLCRWVASLREAFVNPASWSLCQGEIGDPSVPYMAVSMDPSGQRAAAAMAWAMPDGKIALRLLFDVPGSPIDPDVLGKDLRDKAREMGIRLTGFDPLTDAQLARFFPRKEPIAGQKYANASARFVSLIESQKLVWKNCGPVGDDLTWTARKPHDESGSFQAVRADDERPIPAALAAIRAVWLASAPKPALVSDVPAAMGF